MLTEKKSLVAMTPDEQIHELWMIMSCIMGMGDMWI